MQSDDSQWMDPLLWELAADLGGATPAQEGPARAGPATQAPFCPPAAAATAAMWSPPEMQSVSQQLQAAPVQLDHAMSLPVIGSNGTNAAAFAQLSQMACLGPAGILQTHPLGLEYALGAAAAAAAAAANSQRPAASHSPSSSSGGQQGDDYMELAEHMAKKPLNKGALAQKRFRERQKEKMRQNEQQVAELTQQLDTLKMEKARIESRARLLEQVVSLNLTHEARLHTNREIMVREQEMLLDELAEFVLMLDAAAVATGSSVNGAGSLQGMLLGPDTQQQQQQQLNNQAELQPNLEQLQQQRQLDGVASCSPVAALTQALRSWTVAAMTDTIFPQYISRLQQLLRAASAGSSGGLQQHVAASAIAALPASMAAEQEVSKLVLRRREMTDRHALFSHYYWAVWCLNTSEMASACLPGPAPDSWRQVLQQLQLSREQLKAVVAARKSLLVELQRVAAEWQKVLPTLALQLLQVPKEQWHTVAAVQAMVANLAAEREAVVAFLHTIVDEVLTPLQEGQLEASSYPWCPDVWCIAAHAADAAAAAGTSSGNSADSGSSGSGRAGKARKLLQHHSEQRDGGGAAAVQDEDPLAALAMGTDVLQPLMPFMTAFQLLRAPVTARGAGLRLKRALLLDPFKTVVPAAAFPQPSAAEVARMSLLDAHCGTFQKVMLWDWLKANLPGYLSLPGLTPSDVAAAAGPAAATSGLHALAMIGRVC